MKKLGFYFRFSLINHIGFSAEHKPTHTYFSDGMQQDEVLDQSALIIKELKALVVEKEVEIERQEAKLRIFDQELKGLREKLVETQDDLEMAKREISQPCIGMTQLI